MADQEKRDLEELYRLIEKQDKKLFASWGACTAELVDENDPDGYVVIKDSKGHPKLWLPREDFEAFRAMGEKGQ
jgi:hypothetical protein